MRPNDQGATGSDPASRYPPRLISSLMNPLRQSGTAPGAWRRAGGRRVRARGEGGYGCLHGITRGVEGAFAFLKAFSNRFCISKGILRWLRPLKN